MADATTRQCKQCGNDFDSIYQIDEGVCDECKHPIERLLDNAVEKDRDFN